MNISSSWRFVAVICAPYIGDMEPDYHQAKRNVSVGQQFIPLFVGTMGFIIFLAISPVLAAQSRELTAGESTVKVASAALPDAPTPTDDVLAADDLSSPSMDLSSNDLDQQTSQGGTAAAGAQEPHQNPAPPSLEDLGMTPAQTRADPDTQARLDRHTRMLKIHQRLGLITLAPLAAACISSAYAPPDPRKGKENTVGREIHVGLGSASVVMYGLTASYAIRAPRVGDAPARGGIKVHKYLIYIHAPGMILTPILGAMAYNQASNGEKVHGIASAHAAVAWTTVASYSAAIVAVSWPIHLKF
jgi:hypothetical protein